MSDGESNVSAGRATTPMNLMNRAAMHSGHPASIRGDNVSRVCHSTEGPAFIALWPCGKRPSELLYLRGRARLRLHRRPLLNVKRARLPYFFNRGWVICSASSAAFRSACNASRAAVSVSPARLRRAAAIRLAYSAIKPAQAER